MGWASTRDDDHFKKAYVNTNFVESVVYDALFKRQKRLNELFDLCKSYNIHSVMTP